jgi:hypothetical protein
MPTRWAQSRAALVSPARGRHPDYGAAKVAAGPRCQKGERYYQAQRNPRARHHERSASMPGRDGHACLSVKRCNINLAREPSNHREAEKCVSYLRRYRHDRRQHPIERYSVREEHSCHRRAAKRSCEARCLRPDFPSLVCSYQVGKELNLFLTTEPPVQHSGVPEPLTQAPPCLGVRVRPGIAAYPSTP